MRSWRQRLARLRRRARATLSDLRDLQGELARRPAPDPDLARLRRELDPRWWRP